MDDIPPSIPTNSTRFLDAVRAAAHVLGRGAMGVISPVDG